jgi:hypothetical protein
LCRTGDFNLSHTSLTSTPALSTLRELPTINPTLYHEITGDKTTETGTDVSDELPFSAEIEGEDDGCDIPVNVIRSVIMSEGSVIVEGFWNNDGGCIVRMGNAENFEDSMEDENDLAPIVLGPGRHAKTGATRYGVDWEEH